MIVYLLAIASPTHPVSPDLYYSGWAGQSEAAALYRKSVVGIGCGGSLHERHELLWNKAGRGSWQRRTAVFRALFLSGI